MIKEEVQNENNVSSFDNLSNSLGFDLSTPAMPDLSGAPSLAAVSAGNINVNHNEHHHQDGQWTSWHHTNRNSCNATATNISAEGQDAHYLNTISSIPNTRNTGKKSQVIASESHFTEKNSKKTNQDEVAKMTEAAVNAETPKRQVLEVQPHMPSHQPFGEL